MRTKIFSHYFLLIFLSIVISFTSCKKDIVDDIDPTFKTVDKYDYQVVHEWNTVWLEIERHAAGYRPGPVSNSLGYVGLANYEASVSGMPEYASIAHLYPGLSIPKINNNLTKFSFSTISIKILNLYLFDNLSISSSLFNFLLKKELIDIYYVTSNFFK